MQANSQAATASQPTVASFYCGQSRRMSNKKFWWNSTEITSNISLKHNNLGGSCSKRIIRKQKQNNFHSSVFIVWQYINITLHCIQWASKNIVHLKILTLINYQFSLDFCFYVLGSKPYAQPEFNVQGIGLHWTH